jgi:hypothetical protein
MQMALRESERRRHRVPPPPPKKMPERCSGYFFGVVGEVSGASPGYACLSGVNS